GSIAPFSMESYEQAAPWAAAVVDATEEGTMPPWGAINTDECQPAWNWRHDLRLSDEDKQLLVDWLAAGTPEGDPAEAAALPEPTSLDLANPSITLKNPAPFTVGGTKDSFVCMVMDPGHSEELWIDGVQVIPDNAEVVHHVLTYVDTAGVTDDMVDENGMFPCPGGVFFETGVAQMSTWVPGGLPTETPPGVAFRLPVGGKIVLAYHYHPTGNGDEVDQSSVALRWSTQEPDLPGYGIAYGAAFNSSGVEPSPDDVEGEPLFYIPANASGHVETYTLEIPAFVPPISVFAVGTHMHYVGVDMKISVLRGGEEFCVVQTPKWDFNWQRVYDIDLPLDQLPTLQGGDIVKLTCTYDNTLDNPLLAEALAEQGLDQPVPVYVGEQSLEEMCVALVNLATDIPIELFF
ncbi:MAG: hypothetical protein KC457_08495, partial [Myxococcales bacterium]|nr:hypothetical protein [Myxococcales bacterium]